MEIEKGKLLVTIHSLFYYFILIVKKIIDQFLDNHGLLYSFDRNFIQFCTYSYCTFNLDIYRSISMMLFETFL